MKRLDAWMVRRLERACQYLQARTGVTNFTLVGVIDFLLMLVIIEPLVKLRFGLRLDSGDQNIIGLAKGLPPVYFILVLVFLVCALYGSPAQEKQAMVRLANCLSNPRKHTLVHRRLLSIAFLVIMVGVKIFRDELPVNGILAVDFPVKGIVFFASMVATWYLEACDPLVPSEAFAKQ